MNYICEDAEYVATKLGSTTNNFDWVYEDDKIRIVYQTYVKEESLCTEPICIYISVKKPQKRINKWFIFKKISTSYEYIRVYGFDFGEVTTDREGEWKSYLAGLADAESKKQSTMRDTSITKEEERRFEPINDITIFEKEANEKQI